MWKQPWEATATWNSIIELQVTYEAYIGEVPPTIRQRPYQLIVARQ